MSKFAKGKSWIEQRLADEVTIDGALYRAELVARKGTGIQGFRVTVVFLALEGGSDVEAAMPNAASTAEVHAMVRELTNDKERLVSLFREAAAARS